MCPLGGGIRSYVAGALIQAFIAGVTSYIVMSLLGIPFRAPLAVLIALLDLIPLVGATIGAVVVGVVALFVNFPTALIIWVVWSIVYQQVENTVIQPRIQQRAVDVQPFVVLVAVLFGSTLLGVVGALIAVPAAASIQIVLREYLDYRRHPAADPPRCRRTTPEPPDPEPRRRRRRRRARRRPDAAAAPAEQRDPPAATPPPTTKPATAPP